MWMQVPVEVRGAVSPGAKVPGSCEPPSVDAGSQTWVLFKNSENA